MNVVGAISAAFSKISGFFLKSVFETAADQTFAEGQLLDTPEEGIEYGALEMTTGWGDGQARISGGVLELDNSSTTSGYYLQQPDWSRVQHGCCWFFEYAPKLSGKDHRGQIRLRVSGASYFYAVVVDQDNNIPVVFYDSGNNGVAVSHSWNRTTTTQYAVVLGGHSSSGEGYCNGKIVEEYRSGAYYFKKNYGVWILGFVWRNRRTNDYYARFTVPYDPSNDYVARFSKIQQQKTDFTKYLTPWVSDTFEDVDGTSLTNHATNESLSWTEAEFYNSGSASGSGIISSNTATGSPVSGVVGKLYFVEQAGSGAVIEGEAVKAGSNADLCYILVFRVKDVNNFMALGTEPGETTLRLFSVVAGVRTSIASGGTFGSNESAWFVIHDYGTNGDIVVYKNHSKIITASSTTNAAEKGIGFGLTISSSYASQTLKWMRAIPSGVHGEYAAITAEGSDELPLPASVRSLKAWFDAADPISLSQDASAQVEVNENDPVGLWRDKSGNKYYFSSSSNKPTFKTINGMPLVYGDGTQWLENTQDVWQFLHNGSASTVFVVGYTPLNNDQRNGIFGTCGDSVSNKGYSIFYDDRSSVGVNDSVNFLVGSGTTGAAVIYGVPPDDSFPSGTISIAVFAYDYGQSGDDLQIYDKGGQIFTAESTGTAASGTPTYNAQLLATGNGTAPMTGGIAEIIMYSRKLSASEISEITNYLVNKWKL